MRVLLIAGVLILSVLSAGWYLLSASADLTPPDATTAEPAEAQPARKKPVLTASNDPNNIPVAAVEPATQEAPAEEATATEEVSTADKVAGVLDGLGIIKSDKKEDAQPAQPTGPFPEAALANATARLCYFSFNNAQEYRTTSNFVAQLNANSPVKIEVVEFVQHDADIKDALVAAIASGTRCDGVVLSGHHRGKFWGDRSDGSMKAKFLEELSCDARRAPWFANVKAVWLEGCNTGRANLYNDEVDSDERVRGSPLNLISSKLNFGDMEDSLEEINDILLENLNEENLAKDYMRIFPYATVMGWTDISPGEKAGSWYSFPYYMAQVVRLVDPDPKYFQNPMHGKLTPEAARRYSELLYAVLSRGPYGNSDGRDPKLNEQLFIQAWKDHGSYKYKYAFDNPSLAGYRALVMNENEILRQNKALSCVLYQEEQTETVGGVINYLSRNESVTPLASGLILAMMQRSGDSFRNELRETFGKSKSLKQYLQYASQSPNVKDFQREQASSLLAKLGVAQEVAAIPLEVAPAPVVKKPAAKPAPTPTPVVAANTGTTPASPPAEVPPLPARSEPPASPPQQLVVEADAPAEVAENQATETPQVSPAPQALPDPEMPEDLSSRRNLDDGTAGISHRARAE